MKISFTQIYTAEVSFPFCYLMQVLLGKKLSDLVEMSPRFAKRYGFDWGVQFFINASSGSSSNEIRGPGRYRRAKVVEYTIFLPYDVIMKSSNPCQAAIEWILNGVQDVLVKDGHDILPVVGAREAIVQGICADPSMIDGSWT